MAVAMAMGFLFYGGGSASFGSSKEATAALVVSLFPKFPPESNRQSESHPGDHHSLSSSKEKTGPDC